MTARMFGIESEYAVVGRAGKDEEVNHDGVARQVARLIQEQAPHATGLGRCDTFFGNGGRFYVDCGSHPEYCTPECTNPWDVVRYTLAGERMLADACERVPAAFPQVREAAIHKCNVDYSGSGATWGCHESYLHRADPAVLATQLIPHLVSRVIYTGAGGFDARNPGIEFTLSPRASHLEKAISAESTSGRGIVHTKDESLCRGGFHRLHLVCGESLCSELASWLKVGATALVVAMVEAGLRPGEGVELRAPLSALRAIAGDPTCTTVVMTTDRRHMSPIAIQRRYLEAAEAHLGDGFMPPWAAEVCWQWRETLNRLAADPRSLCGALDWAIKLDVYRDHARRRGIDWDTLPSWTYVVERLVAELCQIDGGGWMPRLWEVLGPGSPIREGVGRLDPYLRKKGLRWEGLRPFILLRQELFEIDFKFGRLGPHGLFALLDAAGVRSHGVPGVDNIEHAMLHPPAEGRARLRGETIRRLAGTRKIMCDWQRLWDGAECRALDLSDPFEGTERWRQVTQEDAFG